MSLIAWWPLTRGLENLVDVNTLSGTYTASADGKLGPCLHTTAALTAPFPLEDIDPTVTSSTITCWIKVNQTEIANKFATITSSYNAPTSTILGYNNYGGYALTWTTNSFTSFSTFRVCGSMRGASALATSVYTVPFDTWTHVALVSNVDTKKMQLYINGTPYGSATSYAALESIKNSEYPFYINRASVYSGNGPSMSLPMKLNDVRVYDHALSELEIKELAKALVVHYSFNDIYIEPTTNLLNGYSNSFSKLTLNISSVTNGNKYTITSTTENNGGTSGQIRMYMPLDILTTGTTYYCSFKYKIVSGGTVFKPVDWCDSSLSELTVVDCGDYYQASVKCYTTRTYNTTYRFLDMSMSTNTVVEIWDIQLQTNKLPTPYTPTTRDSLLINETGLTFSTEKELVAIKKDPALGIYCLDTTGGAVINTNITGDVSTGATASMWIKAPTYPTANAVVFADGNSKIAFGFYGTQNAIITCNGYSKPYVSNIASIWKSGDWNHVVIKKFLDSSNNNAETVHIYLNGENIKSKLTGSNNWTHTGQCTIGARLSGSYSPKFSGLIDDFRFYNSPLSDADILDLYSTRGYISNNSNLAATCLVEGSGENSVNSNGLFKTEELYEDIYPGYDIVEYIESTGTQYIDTEYVNTSKDYTYELDMAWTGTNVGAFESFMGYMASSTVPRAAIHKYSSVLMFGGDATTNSSVTPVKGERFWYKGHFKSGDQKLYKNGELIASNKTTFNHSGNTLSTYIFARNNSGKNLSIMRLYEANMYEAEDLVMHFIPARRRSDGALGLYETLGQQFYENKGTGNFITGGATYTEASVAFYEGGHSSANEFIEF
jgi:hypothetical protein